MNLDIAYKENFPLTTSSTHNKHQTLKQGILTPKPLATKSISSQTVSRKPLQTITNTQGQTPSTKQKAPLLDVIVTPQTKIALSTIQKKSSIKKKPKTHLQDTNYEPLYVKPNTEDFLGCHPKDLISPALLPNLFASTIETPLKFEEDYSSFSIGEFSGCVDFDFDISLLPDSVEAPISEGNIIV